MCAKDATPQFPKRKGNPEDPSVELKTLQDHDVKSELGHVRATLTAITKHLGIHDKKLKPNIDDNQYGTSHAGFANHKAPKANGCDYQQVHSYILSKEAC